jgi:pimeloyl-ACP methyl ester carboxylesterase
MNNAGKRRRELYGLLGDLPERRRRIGCRTVSTAERDGYVLESLRLDLNGIEEVPAYFARPAGASGRRPTVLFNHSHGGAYERGKEEMVSSCSYLQLPSYASALTSRGMNALCIDHWAFGERRGRRESEIFKDMLWHGQVMWGMMVFDSIRALDYLCTRPDVDPERIATLGISMGSTMAWWLAALDERVKVCIDLCCMTDFETLIETRGLDGHGIYYYVPGLLKHFTTAQINELILPRAHLCLAGNYDGLTPPAGLDRIDRYMRAAARRTKCPDAWQMVRYDQGHFENPDMRRRVLEFLDEML